MATLILVVAIAIGLVVLFAAVWLRNLRRQADRARALTQRLRVQHAQFVAEQRLQQLTHGALQAMLDVTRNAQRHDG